MKYVLETITYDSSIYTMSHPDLSVPNVIGNSIGMKEL